MAYHHESAVRSTAGINKTQKIRPSMKQEVLFGSESEVLIGDRHRLPRTGTI